MFLSKFKIKLQVNELSSFITETLTFKNAHIEMFHFSGYTFNSVV